MKLRFIYIRCLAAGVAALLLLPGCKKFIAIDPSPSQLTSAQTYSTNASATAAVLTLYSFYNTALYSMPYFTVVGSIQADELQYNGTTSDYLQLYQASATPVNTTIANNFWYYPYSVIRNANLVINGVKSSTALTDSVKNQLIGEAEFFRAYYFYFLVNYFGDVPLTVGASETENATLPRSAASAVWAQIISDLKDAETRMSGAYVSGSAYPRSRVNKYAAAALLARAYLYTKDYANAEAEAGKVIGATDVSYSLQSLSSVFVNTSSEVILQFSTVNGYSTFFGANYRTSDAAAVPIYTLYSGLVSSFESGDQRRVQWVDTVVSNSAKYYKINKYKLVTATAGNEYNVLFRLAEQYLIRAEARAAQNTNLSGAQDDLNAVRHRAGLGDTPAQTSADLVTAVLAERKVELFGETHRWFDLQRSGTLNSVMSSVKPTYLTATKGLLPVPAAQLLQNTNLTQNAGYN